VARLVLESSVLFVTFFGVLLFAAGQKSLYLDLLKGLKGSSSDAGNLLEPTRIKRTRNIDSERVHLHRVPESTASIDGLT
jgi:hypothetical protein